MNLREKLFLLFWLPLNWNLLRCPVWQLGGKYCHSLMFRCVAVAISLSCVTAAYASTTDICDTAAHRAAKEFGVPVSVLWSITRTETGQYRDGRLTPWPWTVNMEGKGHWFKSRRDAQAYALREFERGARSFDVGCFQINYKWHGASFRSIDQMFDPLENARYAAAFLLRLYRESGDWSIAAGAYHSRTQEFSQKYRARFDRIHASYGSEDGIAPGRNSNRQNATTQPSRENTFPLLVHADTPARNGSLVPLVNNHSRALFTIPGISGES
ncbi:MULTISPECIES: transglycosylase SLT domain-containing protein [unclassified Roseovarius]|uniref:transglycosylase SLT domain-containing protein n=1 Tax=unclassified Roseovarius TaxID=2614913 RepID=UPI00273F5A0A|nr:MULTISPECIES: transglycosylase SLT domain-containing protein [unclassified Roseovarius]